MPYKVVYVNDSNEITTIEVEDFEAVDGADMIRLTVSSDDKKEVDRVKYIPSHRFVSAEGEEAWPLHDPDDDDDDDDDPMEDEDD